MSEHGSGSRSLLGQAAGLLGADGVAWLTAGGMVVTWAAALVVPTRAWDLGAPILFLGLALAALLHRLRELRSTEERRFWHVLAAAVGCWLLADVLLLGAPDPLPPAIDVARQLLFAAFYILFLVAVERPPHLTRQQVSTFDGILIWPQAAAVVLGLVLYFSLIPRFLAGGAAHGQVSYVWLLDGFLTLKIGLLVLQVASRRWRLLYGALALVPGALLAADAAEIAALGTPAASGLGRWLWPLAFPVLAAVARLRHLDLGPEREPPPSDPERRLFHLSAQTLGLALAFPLIFFLSHIGDDPSSIVRSAREILVFVWLLILGSLALLQRRILERRMAVLSKERSRIKSEMLSSEIDLRTIIEKRDAERTLRDSVARFKAAFQASPEAMWLCSVDEVRILELNTRARRLLACDERLVGRRFAEIAIRDPAPDGRLDRPGAPGEAVVLRAADGGRRVVLASHLVTLHDACYRLLVAEESA